MKIGAGITGILLGIFSIINVGFLGGMVGSAAGWFGSLGPHGNSTITNWASVVSILSWLAPLLAIIGGIVTFSNPRAGGVTLSASAFLHWYLLGFGVIGNLFVLPIGAAAVLAFFAGRSTSTASDLDATTAISGQSNDISNTTVASFDHAKWNALLQYDTDIASIAERLRPLGQVWLDEFASSYLALNDKQYLPQLEQKIVAAAKVDAEKSEQAKIHLEDERRAEVEAEAKLLQDLERARKQKLQLWRDRFWGNTQRKVLSVTLGLIVVLLVSVAVWPKKYADPFAYCKAVATIDHHDGRYIGPEDHPAIAATGGNWRCMDGELLGCVGERFCMQYDLTSAPNATIREFCLDTRRYDLVTPRSAADFVPNARLGNSAYNWKCNGTLPVTIGFRTRGGLNDFDEHRYLKSAWHKIEPLSAQSTLTTPAPQSNAALAPPDSYEVDIGGCRLFVSKAGYLKYPSGKRTWSGACKNGYAQGIGVQRYYDPSGRLITIAHVEMTRGQGRVIEAYFLDENGQLKGTHPWDPSNMPDWAKEILTSTR